MNFIYISPQFPQIFWNCCDRLKKNGVNVLGIGDTPYDNLAQNVKDSLTEYYWLPTLEDYDGVYRAVAFFAFKYGKIDWLESNNEYWLEQDARLRTDFNITTGIKSDEIGKIKSKAQMKKYYEKAGIPTARQHKVPDRASAEAAGLAETVKAAKDFIAQTGYPVIVKPEIGVGALDTYKLENDSDFDWFFGNLPEHPYVMEEFITGNIASYDAVINSKGEPLFESMTAWPPSIMDIVNRRLDLAYYVAAEMPESLRKLGRAAVKAFDVKGRFVHMEFFCLTKAKPGLGEVGDFVALEVNMRPAGGYTPDMMDYAHSLDVYQIWADMVTFDERRVPAAPVEKFCAYAGRRDEYEYVHSHEEIMEKYAGRIVTCERMPQLMWDQMGNTNYTAILDDEEATREYIRFVQEYKAGSGPDFRK
ncbi:MAG: carbamoylphosphate synthase large subunit [Eubacteriales bacterium]|nr:carbamoylphosphate synthase large subunit [Eubacteriales bacterium]